MTGALSEHQGQVLRACRSTFAVVHALHKGYGQKIPVDFRAQALARYPVGYKSLMGIERKMDSYELSIDEYKQLCQRYQHGWHAMFERLSKP